jgi:hypothetical protein
VGSSPADGCDTCRSSKAERQTVSSSDLVLRPNQCAGPLRGLKILHLVSDHCSLDQTLVLGPHPSGQMRRTGLLLARGHSPAVRVGKPRSTGSLTGPTHDRPPTKRPERRADP